ncbi:MAG: sigma factor-like helix-turn-helix DNA-binding protein [Actinomycetota bacterium]
MKSSEWGWCSMSSMRAKKTSLWKVMPNWLVPPPMLSSKSHHCTQPPIAAPRPGRVEEALEIADTLSLDRPVEEDAPLPGDFILDADAADPEVEVARCERRQAPRACLGTLPQKQAQIVMHRFGLADGRSRPLSEIDVESGIAPERVRQTVNEAAERLRDETTLQDNSDMA